MPDVGPMHVPASDYEPYDNGLPPATTRPAGSMKRDELTMMAQELSQAGITDSEVTYEDGLMDEDFFALQMKLASGQFGGPPIIPEDHNEAARRLLHGHTVKIASEFERELQAHLFEIQMAVEQVRAESFEDAGPELPNETLYGQEITMYQPAAREPANDAVDYSMHEPHDFFERETQMLEKQLAQFDLPQSDCGAGIDALFDAHESLFNLPEPANLEQIIEAHDMPAEAMPTVVPEMPSYDACQMTPELFSQQMQDALGAIGPQGLYDDPALLGYGMPGTYDEQMQRLMDPYVVPGMYDPMLPGPMPDFGPGGGP